MNTKGRLELGCNGVLAQTRKTRFYGSAGHANRTASDLALRIEATAPSIRMPRSRGGGGSFMTLAGKASSNLQYSSIIELELQLLQFTW